MARGQRRQVLLRLDPAVHAAVAKWAADDLRSVNAQIEVLLRRAQMVSNLLVVLCSDQRTQPVVNTGSLYA